MEQILKTYYADNAQKLREIVDRILTKFGGISDKDMDDFYSLANEVFVDAMKRYDRKQPFDGFLYSCLSNRIKTEMTRRNRDKRKIDRMSVSMDMPIDDENSTLADVIADDFDMEKMIFGEENSQSAKLAGYLKRLSEYQRKIVGLLACSYDAKEIQEILHISNKEYSNHMAAIRSYENRKILL